jgi:hypothetical protein
MGGVDPGRLFTDDGRKLRDLDRVGAMSPDTDPPDSGPKTYPPLHSKPRKPAR